VKTGATAASSWNVRRLIESGLGNADAGWPTSLGDSYRLKHTHLPEAMLRRVFPDIPDWPADFRLFEHTTWETEPTARWLRWNEFNGFLSMVLLKVDRASMHESLEVRVPLLDKEVIDVAARVDWRSCLDVERRIGKLPLRHALSRHVRHQTSAKRGFTVPMGEWLRGPLRPIFEELVLERSDFLGLPLSRDSVRAIFDRHLKGESGLEMGLWILLSLALWIQTHWRQ
ncbi:MAG TPA: asparagine synthase-related protein, partial [Rhodothermia bacterium]|nr:asparagine synthase-related protein [Rhodothermia bacterium]